MEDLVFAKRDEEGDLYITVEQMSRIINVDELCLYFHGRNGQMGGCTEAVFYCPNPPQTVRTTGKISLTTTLITGSTISREAIPPHFHFSTKDQTSET